MTAVPPRPAGPDASGDRIAVGHDQSGRPYAVRLPAPDVTAGDGLRSAIADESARHRSLMERAPHGPFELRCTCGWDGGRYDHGWGADGTHAAWRQHLADAVLAMPALRDVLAAAARDAIAQAVYEDGQRAIREGNDRALDPS